MAPRVACEQRSSGLVHQPGLTAQEMPGAALTASVSHSVRSCRPSRDDYTVSPQQQWGHPWPPIPGARVGPAPPSRAPSRWVAWLSGAQQQRREHPSRRGCPGPAQGPSVHVLARFKLRFAFLPLRSEGSFRFQATASVGHVVNKPPPSRRPASALVSGHCHQARRSPWHLPTPTPVLCGRCPRRRGQDSGPPPLPRPCSRRPTGPPRRCGSAGSPGVRVTVSARFALCRWAPTAPSPRVGRLVFRCLVCTPSGASARGSSSGSQTSARSVSPRGSARNLSLRPGWGPRRSGFPASFRPAQALPESSSVSTGSNPLCVCRESAGGAAGRRVHL